MNVLNVATGMFCLYVLILIGLLTGWVMNIITVIGMASAEMTGMFIVRCIAIFVFPLGGVLGWL